jgi:hypothetical protein
VKSAEGGVEYPVSGIESHLRTFAFSLFPFARQILPACPRNLLSGTQFKNPRLLNHYISMYAYTYILSAAAPALPDSICRRPVTGNQRFILRSCFATNNGLLSASREFIRRPTKSAVDETPANRTNRVWRIGRVEYTLAETNPCKSVKSVVKKQKLYPVNPV